jgi:integrase
MRVSEALALRIGDVTVDGLHIRETKCHKSRLVPLHPTAERGLGAYLRERRALGGDAVFPRPNGQPLNYHHVKIVFRELLAAIGIDRWSFSLSGDEVAWGPRTRPSP